MKNKGFTLSEIAMVAAIVSTVSIGGYQLVKKGKDSVCLNNLKQIGQAVAMFEADHDGLPDAVFYPKNESDPKGINNILRKYGATRELFFCPAISSEFNKYGTNYLWNESAKRASSETSNIWLMTEITALYPELTTPHTGGYGVLYADGHAAIGRNINFPDFQKPSLSSTISVEKQKEEKEPVKEKTEKTEKIQNGFKEYQILNLPAKVQSGKPISISIKAIDVEENLYESDEKLKITDFTQTVEPSEITLDKGIVNLMIKFAKSRKNNVLFVSDSKGMWQNSKEFEVEAGSPELLEIVSPQTAYVGMPAIFKIIVKDSFGNIVKKGGIRFSIMSTYEAEYPQNFVSDENGYANIPVIFHKSGENRLTVSISGTTIKESCSIKVGPGMIDHFEISQIKTPVEAGKPVSITVKAVDKYGNRIKGFFFASDSGLPLYVREDMSSGIWMETIVFEKAVSETCIVVSDGMGHIGKSNTFSVIPSSSASIKIFEYEPVVIENQEFEIRFAVLDRYGNFVSGLGSSLSVDGLTESRITESEGQYILTAKLQQPERKNIKILLKKNGSETIKSEFKIDVLPQKSVLKKEQK